MRIMIAGKKGTGKDECAKYLQLKYGGQLISFAQPLYDMMYYSQGKLDIPTHKDRTYLTTMGDYFRSIDPSIFVNTCFRTVNRLREDVNVYITDGRYSNELDKGRENGFYLIQVIANNKIRQVRRPNEAVDDAHSSENGYPADYNFDITITNNGTLEEFHKVVDNLVETLILKSRRINAS
jgi:hypothetical protein